MVHTNNYYIICVFKIIFMHNLIIVIYVNLKINLSNCHNLWYFLKYYSVSFWKIINNLIIDICRHCNVKYRTIIFLFIPCISIHQSNYAFSCMYHELITFLSSPFFRTLNYLLFVRVLLTLHCLLELLCSAVNSVIRT